MTRISTSWDARREPLPFACPARGRIVTYLRADPSELPPFGRALATGNVVVDPRTGTPWLPVVMPDHTEALLEVELVVDFGAPAEPRRPT